MGAGSLVAQLVQAAVFRVHSLHRSNVSMASGPDRQTDDKAAVVTAEGAEEDAAALFHQDLARRMQHLQLQGSRAHLNWLLDACDSALSTHSSLTSAPFFQHSTSAGHRADEMLSMLDLCTSLKQAADDVDRQLCLLQTVLLPMTSATTRPIVRLATARRLQRCLKGLQTISSRDYRPIVDAQASLLVCTKRELLAASHDPTVPASLQLALDGTLLMFLLVLASATAIFAPPTSSRRAATRRAWSLIASYTSNLCSSAARTSGRTPAAISVAWAAPLRQLQRSLNQDDMNALFLEIQEVQFAASSLHAALASPPCLIPDQELRLPIECLWKRSREARCCISELRSHLDSVFQALLNLRLALLR